jgi:hypothetical protein
MDVKQFYGADMLLRKVSWQARNSPHCMESAASLELIKLAATSQPQPKEPSPHSTRIIVHIITNSYVEFTGDAYIYNFKKTKLLGFSPRANYADRATAACQRSWCQIFADRVCRVVSATELQGRILGFLDRIHIQLHVIMIKQ